MVKIFEIPRFWSKLSKISILDTIFEKERFLVKTRKNYKFGPTFRKNIDFIRNIPILVQISAILNFGQNFWKILIEVKIYEISRIYSEHLDCGPDFGKSRFW